MKNRSLSLFLLVLITSSTLAAELTSRDPIRDIQKLLSLKGYYEGSIDGLNGPKTEKAILLYEQEAGWPLTGKSSAKLVERLRAETRSVLTKATSKPQNTHSLPNEVTELINRVEGLEREWKGDYQNRTKILLEFTEKTADFNKSAFDAAAFVANNTVSFISLMIAGIGVVAGVFSGVFAVFIRRMVFADVTANATTHIDRHIAKEKDALNDALKKVHTAVLELGKTQVSPRIYSNLGMEYWRLHEATKHLATEHRTYLEMAICLTEWAYKNTRDLDMKNRDNRIFCRMIENNYAYFLTKRQHPEDSELALRLARKCYRESDDLREEGEEPAWYAFKETYAYVLKRFSNLRHDIEESNKIIDELKSNASLPLDYRRSLERSNATSS